MFETLDLTQRNKKNKITHHFSASWLNRPNTSDGVARLGLGLRSGSLGLEGLVSVSKDFGLGLKLLVSRLCIGYFS